MLRDLSKNVKGKGTANSKLDKDLLDLNVVVNERRHIEEVNGEFIHACQFVASEICSILRLLPVTLKNSSVL